MSKSSTDRLDRQFLKLMRARDFKGAVEFFSERVHEALQAKSEETTVHASHLLIASLIAAGPDQDALILLWKVITFVPGDAYLRSAFADFLLSTLKQPAQALAVLDPVLEELLAEEGSRHATLGLRGTILLALGRAQEAERCFQEMLQPSLWRMDPAGFDFRLVESLILGGLVKEECERYLQIVSQRAQQVNDKGVMTRVEHLLSLLR